eukprot:CAMPEP_0202692778 /NCGR_PEP_ID=MMETSP1385-20130828/7084_1 /ASSEMBLY_ACC=CAM_ASM_000861 /TAXON_ID=933848 /ORGANISM="Elphidium margaritaceum" /LENGTH=206 /DNA_ID=CAMNT_0049348373 /DNA_START=29 /DNA_END=649 /DNA_ORIENTATION=-
MSNISNKYAKIEKVDMRVKNVNNQSESRSEIELRMLKNDVLTLKSGMCMLQIELRMLKKAMHIDLFLPPPHSPPNSKTIKTRDHDDGARDHDAESKLVAIDNDHDDGGDALLASKLDNDDGGDGGDAFDHESKLDNAMMVSENSNSDNSDVESDTSSLQCRLMNGELSAVAIHRVAISRNAASKKRKVNNNNNNCDNPPPHKKRRM